MSARNSMPKWLGELQVPIHWLAPERVGQTGEDEFDRIRVFNPRISVERVFDTSELMVFPQSDPRVARPIELVGEEPQQTPATHDARTCFV